MLLESDRCKLRIVHNVFSYRYTVFLQNNRKLFSSQVAAKKICLFYFFVNDHVGQFLSTICSNSMIDSVLSQQSFRLFPNAKNPVEGDPFI